MTRTAQDPRQTFTLGAPKAQPEKHFPGIEQPHRLVTDDGKAILAEIPPPPTRMKQPQLGDDIPPFAVSSGQAEADRVPGRSIPRVPQSLQLGGAWHCLRNKPRQRRRGKRDRLEVRRQRGPQPPGVGRKNVEAGPVWRQYASD